MPLMFPDANTYRTAAVVRYPASTRLSWTLSYPSTIYHASIITRLAAPSSKKSEVFFGSLKF